MMDAMSKVLFIMNMIQSCCHFSDNGVKCHLNLFLWMSLFIDKQMNNLSSLWMIWMLFLISIVSFNKGISSDEAN